MSSKKPNDGGTITELRLVTQLKLSGEIIGCKKPTDQDLLEAGYVKYADDNTQVKTINGRSFFSPSYIKRYCENAIFREVSMVNASWTQKLQELIKELESESTKNSFGIIILEIQRHTKMTKQRLEGFNLAKKAFIAKLEKLIKAERSEVSRSEGVEK